MKLAAVIIKEQSKASLNAFKQAEWPLHLIKNQTPNLKLRCAILNLCKKVIQYQDLQLLLQQTEILNTRFEEALNIDQSQLLQNPQTLKYTKTLCSYIFKVLNLVSLDRHNFDLFASFINSFYRLGFDSTFNESLNHIYHNERLEIDESAVLKAERILGFGIGFIKGLLDNPSIWVSDMLFSDRDSEETSKAEEYLNKHVFSSETIQKILQTVVTKYFILTQDEVNLWKEDSLKYFLHQKYQSNETKGNFLREKGRNLIAGIQFRFSAQMDQFCAFLIAELQKSSGQSLDLIGQVQKEAILQVIEIRIHDESGIDSLQFLNLIEPELRLSNNLIVKKSMIQLLSKLSDFDVLQSQLNLQESFIREVMSIFASSDNDNQDLCLKMACVEYMKNFYNQQNFRVDAYSHFLGDVLTMCNDMIMRTYTQNTEILNEILELYRFIVEKYANHTSQQAHIQKLVEFLKQIWEFFEKKQVEGQKGQEEGKEEDEINIALQSILRIMTQIIAQLPIIELPTSLTSIIISIALSQAYYVINSKNVMLSEYSLTLLIVIFRRLNNLTVTSQDHEELILLQQQLIIKNQKEITSILLNMPMQASADEEASKYFLLMEELIGSLSLIGMFNYHVQDFQQLMRSLTQRIIVDFIEQVETLSVISYVLSTLRYVTLLLNDNQTAETFQLLSEFLKQTIAKHFTDVTQITEEEKLNWVTVSSGLVCTFLMVKQYEVAKDLTLYLMTNPQFNSLVIDKVGFTQDTQIILFAAYSLKIIPQGQLNQETTENVTNVFKNHVESEVNNALEYDFRLNRDLMEFNDTEEEQLFFEITQKTMIEADFKEKVLKSWIPREIELIKEAADSL